MYNRRHTKPFHFLYKELYSGAYDVLYIDRYCLCATKSKQLGGVPAAGARPNGARDYRAGGLNPKRGS